MIVLCSSHPEVWTLLAWEALGNKASLCILGRTRDWENGEDAVILGFFLLTGG